MPIMWWPRGTDPEKYDLLFRRKYGGLAFDPACCCEDYNWTGCCPKAPSWIDLTFTRLVEFYGPYCADYNLCEETLSGVKFHLLYDPILTWYADAGNECWYSVKINEKRCNVWEEGRVWYLWATAMLSINQHDPANTYINGGVARGLYAPSSIKPYGDGIQNSHPGVNFVYQRTPVPTQCLGLELILDPAHDHIERGDFCCMREYIGPPPPAGDIGCDDGHVLPNGQDSQEMQDPSATCLFQTSPTAIVPPIPQPIPNPWPENP
jgi:hypothetical protein